ncbi:nitroreductase/quinone reductase family protein [Cryptosporangium aurantiacum]|uniref:Deazaflavin-dependent oxidoreductase, nitroreductase family n=1 Tax=Cryptosporangium aurantiacum TaxID=134849 RepID=A0A1M7JZL9_9ACTN|nr:nitroreductase/quinone reductase family protein [Cryptosporangium aurantiacum]SHM58522.1 deazaflavin-dependent oxidoreductase, nitroreductase family [Cryptosporangium aurantiacum]
MAELPRWLPAANRVVRVLNRANLRLGTIHVLTVPGRVSGKPRTTPVSPLRVDGKRYVIAGLAEAQWARNVRAAGSGTLAYGRRTERVRLAEVTDPGVRRAVMRAFPTEVPHGVAFFVQLGLVRRADPDEFEAAADQVAVFEVDVERPGSHEGSRAG